MLPDCWPDLYWIDERFRRGAFVLRSVIAFTAVRRYRRRDIPGLPPARRTCVASCFVLLPGHYSDRGYYLTLRALLFCAAY